MTRQSLLDYLQSHGVDTHQSRTTPTHVILRECPFCSKPTNNKSDNLYKMYIQIGSGAYFCHRCGSGGSYFDLKGQLGGDPSAGVFSAASSLGYKAGGAGGSSYNHGPAGGSMGAQLQNHQSKKSGRHGDVASYVPFSHPGTSTSSGGIPCLPMPPQRLQAVYSTDLFTDDENNSNKVLDYLVNTRGLSPKTLRKYGVGKAKYAFPSETNGGRWVKADCVTFSWIMSVKDIEYQESLRGAKYVHQDDGREAGLEKEKAKKTSLMEVAEPSDSVEEDQHQPVSHEKASSSGEDGDADPKEHTFVTRRIKARALENKAWQRLDPPGGAWGFFGYHTVPRGCKEVVITEGEYDAMAVWQATGRPAISLPNGCRSLPVEALPLLEDFDKIFLWMDNDGPGQEGAELFARKLGLERCYLVRPTLANSGVDTEDRLPKDANEALLGGFDLDTIVRDAKLTPHERILSFDDLRQEVLHEILNPDQYSGTPLPSLPKFTSIIKGLRRGELTVLTGPVSLPSFSHWLLSRLSTPLDLILIQSFLIYIKTTFTL